MALHGQLPQYLAEDCQLLTDIGRRSLRSADVLTCVTKKNTNASRRQEFFFSRWTVSLELSACRITWQRHLTCTVWETFEDTLVYVGLRRIVTVAFLRRVQIFLLTSFLHKLQTAPDRSLCVTKCKIPHFEIEIQNLHSEGHSQQMGGKPPTRWSCAEEAKPGGGRPAWLWPADLRSVWDRSTPLPFMAMDTFSRVVPRTKTHLSDKTIHCCRSTGVAHASILVAFDARLKPAFGVC